MAEFTGERVIPGQVDTDLWNEHLARYVFATRLCRNKKVLDVGCGAGYGTAQLAKEACFAVGVDLAADALAYAASHYSRPNLVFLPASCTALPFRDQSFDLVASFEVIEHIAAWREMIEEARRVLRPNGQFIVSTPNARYYREARAQAGPNPFHHHEFEFDEFREVLQAVFPSVTLFLQNHSAGIVFQPLDPDEAAEVVVAARAPDPSQSHFFIAVCALAPQLGAPTFVYLPATGNLLREREMHIRKLQEELATKSAWLDEAHRRHEELVAAHRMLIQEMEQKNLWAEELNREIESCRKRIEDLDQELITQAQKYERELARIHQESREYVEWAQENERQLRKQLEEVSADLAARCAELARCVELLHESEALVEERTLWAQSLDTEVHELRSRVDAYQRQIELARNSRWIRLGRSLGVGPKFIDS